MNITDILTSVIAALGISFMALLAIAPVLLDHEPVRTRRRDISRPRRSDHVMAA